MGTEARFYRHGIFGHKADQRMIIQQKTDSFGHGLSRMTRTTIKYKEIWVIAYPIILGSLAQNVLNVTDTAFLGRVGEIALGASAIGGVFYLAVVMLAWGFGIGTQIIIARRNGEMEYGRIGGTVAHSLYFLVPLSVILFILMRFFSNEVLQYIIKSPQVLESTTIFIRYRSYGIFLATVSIAFRAFFIGIMQTRVIIWSTIVLALFNIILDYVLIFGKFGFPEMGIAGAALASVIAEATGVIFLVLYTVARIPNEKYRIFKLHRFSWDDYTRHIRISLPVMGQHFLSMSSWLVFFLLVEKLGERALAVSNIIRSYYVVLMIPIWGLASATSTLVSNLIGQGRNSEIIPLMNKIVRLCFMLVLGLGMLGSLFPRQALMVYTPDQELIRASLDVLYVANIAAVALGVAFIFFNALAGTGKTQVSFIIEMVVITIYLAITYILTEGIQANITMVWTVEIVYGATMAALSRIYLRYGKWHSIRV
jgi:putative MATE family efflux protein